MQRIFAVMLVGWAAIAAVLAQTRPEQLDIEAGAPGQPPPGWFLPTPGYTAELSTTAPRAGQRCARLAGPTGSERAPFGNLMCTLDAAPYRGKSVRLRAAVRVVGQSAADRAQLWLRVDRSNGQMGFFDNMGDRPITAPEWRDYEITGAIAADAGTINIGLMLIRAGEAWLDDVRLQVVDASPSAPDPPRALTPRGLENLIAFTRLLGCVRYFHPSDQAASTDWDAFAIAGIPAVEPALDADQLAATLERLFRPIAPTVRVYPTGKKPELPAELTAAAHDSLRLLTWQHTGLGAVGAAGQPSTKGYQSRRAEFDAGATTKPAWVAPPDTPWEAELAGGVSGLVPLTLYADEDGTLPHAPKSGPATSAPAAAPYSGNQRATRLAGVALAWNVFEHFYPYFDVVQSNWSAALPVALKSAATDKDERAFVDTLRRLVVELHDGHGSVRHNSDAALATPPFAWDWIDGQLVITAIPPENPTTAPASAPSSAAAAPPATAAPAIQSPDRERGLVLRPGDIVVALDGRAIAERMAETEALISAATPQWRRWRALLQIGRGEPGQTRTLTIQRHAGSGPDGPGNPNKSVEFSTTYRCETGEHPNLEPRPDKIAEIRPGIFYVDVAEVSDADLQAALPRLATATGVIYDFRGYPSQVNPNALFGPLIEKKVNSPQWHVPVLTRPDQQGLRFQRLPGWVLKPSEPHIKGRRAFLIDGRAISYAESCLGIVEHYKLGELVGAPTAGTNGNVNPITLPGGYTIWWTGMKVLKNDGTQHHGVGIQPTIPVQRTVAGVLAGRDEVLERAIEVVSVPQPPP